MNDASTQPTEPAPPDGQHEAGRGFIEALMQAAADLRGARWAALVDPGAGGLFHVTAAVGDEPAHLVDALAARPFPAALRQLERPCASRDGDAAASELGGLEQACAADLELYPVGHETHPGTHLLLAGLDGQPAECASVLQALARATALFGHPSHRSRLIGPAIDSAAAGVTIADARAEDEPLVYINERFEHMTGYPRRDVLGRNCRFLQGDHRSQEAVTRIRRAMESGEGCEVLLYNFRRDGRPFWNEFRLAPVHDADGVLTHFIGIQHDVTEREELRERIEHERAEFRRVIRVSPSGILVLDDSAGDHSGRILLANPAAAQMLGTDEEALTGRVFGTPLVNGSTTEITIRRTAGEGGGTGIAELSVTDIEWAGQSAQLVTLHDVTARRRAEERAERMAYSDTLTGLANRDCLNENLDEALRAAGRAGTRAALIMLDMDRFKEINDTLGHAQGDAFLVQVAERLRATLRDSDLVARVGGDEFAVLLAGSPGHGATHAVCEKIVAAFTEPLQLGDHRISTTASVGFSLFPDDAADAEALMRNADAAMYAAKRSGGAAARAFDPSFTERTTQRFELDQRLPTALAERQFEVHFQPQVRLGAQPRLAGLEALVRWRHPESGLIGPASFIEPLEELDLIGQLTMYVLEAVCERLGEWGDALPPGASVAINLSARELRHETLAQDVAEVLRRHGVSPGRITFELTESAAATDITQAMHTLGELRAQGTRVSLDDFGKGFSALNYLRVLPIDVVKVDREFVQRLPGEEASAALVRAIVAMAHGIGKQVLAEGVETPEQAAFLRQIGCDMAQGFHFGHPVPGDSVSLQDSFPAI